MAEGVRSFAAFWMGGAALVGGVVEPPIPSEQSSGGWEEVARHQARRRKNQRELEERLAREQEALEQAAIELAAIEAQKVAEASAAKANQTKLRRLDREISAERERLAGIQEHIDALLTLIYLENEQRARIEQQTKRKRAIALLLLVH